jgi:methanogenic corrinoid protein MtbC1
MTSFDDLKTAMGDLEDEKVMEILDELARAGGKDAALALAACQGGMDIVGQKYETGEYYVGDLIFAGDLMSQAAAALKPFLTGEAGASIGKMVFCTVNGDIHDIGKNIVKSLLEADGIEVIDLGVDIEPEAIVQAVKENAVNVIALSGVLTLSIESMKKTVEALAAAGLRDKTKVIIGGAPVTADFCAIVGADAWSLNAAEGVRICHNWLVS